MIDFILSWALYKQKTLASRLLGDWGNGWKMNIYRWLMKWEQVNDKHQEIKRHNISGNEIGITWQFDWECYQYSQVPL